MKLETDGEKELNTIVKEDNELDKNDIVDFAEVSDLDDNLEYNRLQILFKIIRIVSGLLRCKTIDEKLMYIVQTKDN